MTPLIQRMRDLIPLATTPEARRFIREAIRAEEENGKERAIARLIHGDPEAVPDGKIYGRNPIDDLMNNSRGAEPQTRRAMPGEEAL